MDKIFKIVFLLILSVCELCAQKTGELKGLYGSINLGLGVINGDITNEYYSTNGQFAMHFNVGIFICRYLQTGITLNGWLFESFEEIPYAYKFESISNGMIHLQVYPVRNKRLFIKGAYGITEYTNLRPEKNSGKGRALMVAFGYEREFRLNKKENNDDLFFTEATVYDKRKNMQKFFWGIQISYNSGRLNYTSFPGISSLVDRRFQTIDLTLILAID